MNSTETRSSVFQYRIILVAALIVLSLVLALSLNEVRKISAFLDQQPARVIWDIPSSIYAAAPEIQPGMSTTPEWLEHYLQKTGYHETLNPILQDSEYHAAGDAVAFKSAHSPFAVMVHFNKNGVAQMNDLSANATINRYQLDPVLLSRIYDSNWDRHSTVSLKQVPEHLQEAVIAIEDRRFYRHSGVDGIAIVRAAVRNVINRACSQGASTITQQLARNLYLTREKSFRRKIKEALIAVVLEKKHSKNQILESYLNEVYLGQRGPMSIRGVSEASRLYFNKDVRQLTFQEAALLAGMIQAPLRYDPYNHPADALQRRNAVLQAMRDTGKITPQQYAMYSSSPMVVHPLPPEERRAPYFADFVVRNVQKSINAKELMHGRLAIHTTLDADMQQMAEASLETGLQRIDKYRFNKVHKRVEGCLIAVDPATGRVLAYVGGRDYSRSQYDRISQALRQPGSAFKPFVYSAAMESAFDSSQVVFTPATLVIDEPSNKEYQSAAYQPENYDGEYHGIVTARMALAESMNLATVQLSEEVGISKVVAMARAFGFQDVKPYPSLPLGTMEVSPWQLIQAYTAFVHNGARVDLSAVTDVTNEKGNLLMKTEPKQQQVLHPQSAYLVTDMLKTVVTSGTGASMKRLGFTRPAAGKTGTTDDFRDAWFIGFTPNLMTLVWVGYDDNTSVQMNGAQAALPIWVDFMKKAEADAPAKDFEKPNGIVTKLIDPTTGKLATESCPEAVEEIFIQGTEPVESCSDLYHSMSPETLLLQQTIAGKSPSQQVISTTFVPTQKQQQTQPASDQFIYFAPPPNPQKNQQ